MNRVAPIKPSSGNATALSGVPLSPAARKRIIAPLARGLDLLSAFTTADQWLGNLELAMRTRLPPSTANRIAKSLAQLGYLDYSRQRRQYRLGSGVLTLGYAAVATSPFRSFARADLQRFADDHHLFVAIGQRDRLDIMIVECFRSNSSALTVRLDAGSRVPIANTAAGWALMSELPEDERAFLLSHIKRRYGRNWLEQSRGMTQALSQLGRKGYCVSFGNWHSEITSVGVPLVTADHTSIMSLICSGAAPFLSSRRISDEVGPELVALAERLKNLPATAAA